MKPKADYRPLIEKWQDVVIELHNKKGQMFPGGEDHSPFDFFEAGYKLRDRELNQKLEECASKYLDQSFKYQDALDALLGVRDSLREAVEVIKIIHHNLPNIEDKSDVDLRWHVEDFMEKIGEKHEQKGGSR